MLFHTASAEDFVRGSDPVTLLGSMNKIVFVSEQEKSCVGFFERMTILIVNSAGSNHDTRVEMCLLISRTLRYSVKVISNPS